jgi:hypothetical protein
MAMAVLTGIALVYLENLFAVRPTAPQWPGSTTQLEGSNCDIGDTETD